MNKVIVLDINMGNKSVQSRLFSPIITRKIKLNLGEVEQKPGNDNLKPLPAFLYNSKTNKKAFGMFDQLRGLANSEAMTVKTMNFLSGTYLYLVIILDPKNDQLKTRLRYEWKNIFRALSLVDINQTG